MRRCILSCFAKAGFKTPVENKPNVRIPPSVEKVQVEVKTIRDKEMDAEALFDLATDMVKNLVN